MRIAGEFTTADWQDLRPTLDVQDSERLSEAIKILDKRIQTRYMDPVQVLQSQLYAGFAVMTLNCLLIDTIQSFREGRVEPGSTAHAFKTFLKSDRFSEFNSEDRGDFFDCVRNGLFTMVKPEKAGESEQIQARYLRKVLRAGRA